MLGAGARGYVDKVSAFRELIEAVRAVMADEIYLSPSVARKPQPLSPRDRQVLQLLAAGKVNKEVARHLDISIKTAETCRRNIMVQPGAIGQADVADDCIEGLGVERAQRGGVVLGDAQFVSDALEERAERTAGVGEILHEQDLSERSPFRPFGAAGRGVLHRLPAAGGQLDDKARPLSFPSLSARSDPSRGTRILRKRPSSRSTVVGLHSRTGKGEPRRTRSATLPRIHRTRPVRPWVDMAMSEGR